MMHIHGLTITRITSRCHVSSSLVIGFRACACHDFRSRWSEKYSNRQMKSSYNEARRRMGGVLIREIVNTPCMLLPRLQPNSLHHRTEGSLTPGRLPPLLIQDSLPPESSIKCGGGQQPALRKPPRIRPILTLHPFTIRLRNLPSSSTPVPTVPLYQLPPWPRFDMQQAQDLIDEGQVALFDALKELSGLNVSSRIETPQLVVVGDQNTGKSSVLEALSRFPFQVHNEICTRFPIKLILRRSHEEVTHLRIEPATWRSESDQQRLRDFSEHLSNLDGFPDKMRKVTEELGGSLSHESKEIFDDTLVVESSGPHFSQLDLVDFPGLFQVATNVQGESSMQKADELVERHVKSKRTLVLLIVSARVDFHTQSCQKTIQNLSVQDSGLPLRVIGVMTNPDRAISVSDSLKVINGGLYSKSLTHKWIVIRNRDEKERGKTLDHRDLKEEEFFRDDPNWKHVSPDKRGIEALRISLKAAFLEHTADSLPQVINEIRKKHSNNRSSPQGNKQSQKDPQRSTDISPQSCSRVRNTHWRSMSRDVPGRNMQENPPTEP